MSDITLSSLTEGTVNGNGVFDKLMAATKEHLEQQFVTGALKGADYAQVYLGSIQQVLQTAAAFVTTQQKINLETQLLEQQVILAKVQVEKANAEVELMQQQVLNAQQEVLLSQQQVIKIQEEIKLLPKQLEQMIAQTSLINQQLANAQAEKLQIEAQTLNIPKQGLQIEAQTALITQQQENAAQEKLNLVAQECLLRAQFDSTVQNTQKSAAEEDLLKQKIVTEKAQTMELGVDENSVVGRQKDLFLAQKNGFNRDAEQKAVKIWVDTWTSRRMTDEGTVADGVNLLNDATGGRLMTALLNGIGA